MEDNNRSHLPGIMTKKKFHIVIVDDEPNYRTKLAARLADTWNMASLGYVV